MKITFRENVFVREYFLCKQQRKQPIENKPVLWGTPRKAHSSFNFREIRNL